MFKNLMAIMSKAAEKENFMCRKGGAKEFEVNELEDSFSITLPADYKFYLLEYGYTVWFGEIICGFVDKGAMFEGDADLIPVTQYYKELYNNKNYFSVPYEGVVIGSYDGGGYYFLFSQESERAGEVGLFLTETYGQEVSKFKSFTDYLSFLVTGTPAPESVDVDYDKIIEIDIIED